MLALIFLVWMKVVGRVVYGILTVEMAWQAYILEENKVALHVKVRILARK